MKKEVLSAKRIALYGLLTSVMLALGFVEWQFTLVPSVPGIRLGLSNTVLLYALCLMGVKSAWLLLSLKVLLGGFLYAGVSGMMYSLSGGVLGMLAMWFTLWLGGFGLIGISVSGASFHMMGQLLVYRISLGSWAALIQAPLLLAASVATGILTGIAAQSVCHALARGDVQMKDRLERIGLTGRKSS